MALAKENDIEYTVMADEIRAIVAQKQAEMDAEMAQETDPLLEHKEPSKHAIEGEEETAPAVKTKPSEHASRAGDA